MWQSAHFIVVINVCKCVILFSIVFRYLAMNATLALALHLRLSLRTDPKLSDDITRQREGIFIGAHHCVLLCSLFSQLVRVKQPDDYANSG